MLGTRTIFNLLGPLTNPANTKNQLLGVYEEKLVKIEKSMDSLEEINQKVTLQEKNQANINEKLSTFETMLKRPNVGQSVQSIDSKLEAIHKYMRKGVQNLSPDETKALTVSDDTQAGYYAPPEYMNEIIKTLTEISPVRSIATVSYTHLTLPTKRIV